MADLFGTPGYEKYTYDYQITAKDMGDVEV